jgi:hypothetical protein
MTSMNKLQELHDQMIASRPEGISCPEGCVYCSGEYASSLEGGNQVSDKTITEEESKALIAAAVAEATSEAQAKIAVLEAAAEEAAKKAPPANDDDEDDAPYKKAKADLEEMTIKLDAAVLEAEAAKRERDELASWLQSEADKVVAEAEMATKRADRIAQVAEVVTFPEAHVEERADMWASLDDDKFEALLADYKALDVKKPSDSGPLPHFTAMQAARDESDSSVVGPALRHLIRGSRSGVDPRAIR